MSVFTKMNKEQFDCLPDYEKKIIRSKHYVEDENFLNIEWIENG